jgi:hypothetical protein
MILTDWMINLVGRKLISNFDREMVNPASVDCNFGIELPDLPARLFPDSTMELTI